MVDGEALVMMMVMISSNSPSRQGARTEFLTPRRGFLMAVEFRKGFVSSVDPPDGFRSRGLSSQEGLRGGARALHTMWWRGHGPTTPSRGVGAPLPLSISSSGSGSLRVK